MSVLPRLVLPSPGPSLLSKSSVAPPFTPVVSLSFSTPVPNLQFPFLHVPVSRSQCSCFPVFPVLMRSRTSSVFPLSRNQVTLLVLQPRSVLSLPSLLTNRLYAPSSPHPSPGPPPVPGAPSRRLNGPHEASSQAPPVSDVCFSPSSSRLAPSCHTVPPDPPSLPTGPARPPAPPGAIRDGGPGRRPLLPFFRDQPVPRTGRGMERPSIRDSRRSRVQGAARPLPPSSSTVDRPYRPPEVTEPVRTLPPFFPSP